MSIGKAVVLGSGPAGLFAAEACEQLGYEVHIVSGPNKSVLKGAQYLHRHIPGITSAQPDGMVEIEGWGTPDQYALKIYSNDKAETSWGEFVGKKVPAWDLSFAYDVAWSKHNDKIKVDMVSGAKLFEWYSDDKPEVLINSIPLSELCLTRYLPLHERISSGTCTFHSQTVWASIDCFHKSGENKIVYNGLKEPSWYRSASIFGRGSTEWGIKPPIECMKVEKPLSTTCNCWSGILHVGRYGTWTKGTLSHEAYWNVIEEIDHEVH